jgi:SMC interacting uncharacterized protein involved in chromosome segregation
MAFVIDLRWYVRFLQCIQMAKGLDANLSYKPTISEIYLDYNQDSFQCFLPACMKRELMMWQIDEDCFRY